MLPKIEAAVEFVRMGGPQAIITDPPNLARALRGENWHAHHTRARPYVQARTGKLRLSFCLIVNGRNVKG